MKTFRFLPKRKKPISYADYVTKFTEQVLSFSSNLDSEVILRLALREMLLLEIRNFVIMLSPFLLFGYTYYCFKDNSLLIPVLLSLGIIVIGITYFIGNKYLTNWLFYTSLKTRTLDYIKVVIYTGIDIDILRSYLLKSKIERPAVFAEALYKETVEAWIKDKNLQKTSFERILILYYILNKQLNVSKNQNELVFLVSCLIKVGESNASGDKMKALRSLNEMYFDKIPAKEQETLRRVLTKTKSILKETLELIERDISKLDSLK